MAMVVTMYSVETLMSVKRLQQGCFDTFAMILSSLRGMVPRPGNHQPHQVSLGVWSALGLAILAEKGHSILLLQQQIPLRILAKRQTS